MPSVAESLPRAILEAMAASVPVVAADAGGIPEILNYGKFGSMVAAKNEKALAEGVALVWQKCLKGKDGTC